MEKLRLGRITDGSITTALLHLRAEIIREGQDGLEHVEALLHLRGVDPADHYVPQKVPRQFARNRLRMAILRALRDGPQTGRQLAEWVAAYHGDMTPERAYKRVYGALHQMQKAGLVAREGRVWQLALGPVT